MKLTTPLLLLALPLSVALSGCSKKESDGKNEPQTKDSAAPAEANAAKGSAAPAEANAAKGSAAPARANAAKGLAAADNDPALDAWGKEVAGCKEFNTNCPAYKQKSQVSKGDDASKARARATMFNWMEEPSNVIVRHAGAHVLWSEWLVNDAVATDTKLFARALAALKAEPGFGKETSNRYAAGQMADVISKFANSAPNRPAIAAFIGDKGYAFASARVEAIRLLPEAALNDPSVFSTIQRVAEDGSEPSEVRSAIVWLLRGAQDDNRVWARTFLRTQVVSTDASLAGDAAQALAVYGESSDADALFASIETRASRSDDVGDACRAAQEYMRRTDVTFNKAKGVSTLAKVVRDEKARSVSRLLALQAVYEARDPQTVPLGTLLSRVKEESIAKQAKDIVEKYKKAPKK